MHGIPNCDQIKKARAWLSARGVAHRFHDFRRDGLNPATLQEWITELGWEALLNRKGTSWRALAEADRPSDEAGAIALMLRQPAVIKRPLLTIAGKPVVGFSEPAYTALFS